MVKRVKIFKGGETKSTSPKTPKRGVEKGYKRGGPLVG